MKQRYIVILLFTVSLSAFSQRIMIAHKTDGTKEYTRLSAVDSVTFLEPFVSVAGGTFTAGATLTTISSFKIDKYEVSYELWTDVRVWGLGNGYTDLVAGQKGYNPVGTNHPVTKVNWYDIVKWCNARSQRDGLTPVYYTSTSFIPENIYKTGTTNLVNTNVSWTANGYRLPTEAEWEFAARGGNSTHGYTYSGSNTVDDVAWYSANSGYTSHSIGNKTANELGLYDMSGNMFEWCWDWFSGTYPNVGSTDPQGPTTTQSYRVLRGGSFNVPATYSQVDFRNSEFPSQNTSFFYGFRCVQD